MKKVLCIKQGNWIGVVSNTVFDGPKYNEICTVVEETFDAYLLLEWPDDAGWDKCRFIPLSDKDETEYADEVLTRLFQPVKF